ncbi:MAG: aldehyde dehydrogenase (NAD+) [Rhodobacteraceae bacterium HLUCCA12]|nr:MAG: aldehyde dehydrogenase (NAD+) [Rhodobacteraceae bacterium HLUCCA12]
MIVNAAEEISADCRFASFIDGENWPESRRCLTLVNPANGQPWGIADTDPAAIDAAVGSARAAFDSGVWSDLTPYQRAGFLRRFGDLIRENAGALSELESLASGKVHAATRAEMTVAADWYYYYASALETIDDKRRVLTSNSEAMITREPIGVVVAITPFNGALSLGSWKLAPALAMGNAVILKPPVDAAGSSIRLGQLAIEAGIPKGIVNTVVADSSDGERLATHPGVNMVSFTGSTQVARHLGGKVTASLKRFVCEGGGKSAHIVFEDGNVEAAAIAATHGAFSGTGQTCVAGSRLLIQRSVFDRFVEKYLASVARIRLGAPASPGAHLGPLASERQFRKVLSYIQDARDAGATILAGGDVPEMEGDLAGGFWISPTVISDVNLDMLVCREEIFGPVVTLQPFDTEEEAINMANSLEYGLAAGFWSQDPMRIRRVSRKLQAGSVWVNTYRAINLRAPFGGYKQSGLGRENGVEALDEFSQIKTIVQEYGPPADPFAN